ncbi:pupal cuticle protein Edg-78E-like [Drosophila innubila]|uniref:pupal cuticle protein Edg-78E-like n=1 Tax=Drosophila innubila TaxID=198719 RepID=UPI00148D8B8E|nr:pupal cuticle protein Edg-78E-like [Drosophila innubila]
MFKLSLCLVAALLVCALGDHINKDAQILSERSSTPDSEGNFAYAFETSNGINQQASGNINGVSGESEFVAPNGEVIKTTYTADENGYHPQGDHLPTPPPYPDYVVRLLQYLAEHAPQE